MCSTIVTHAGLVCVNCFKELDFVKKPYCRSCARPFISDDEAGKNYFCLECQATLFPWHEFRAAFLYNEGIKKLIMPLKYGDQQKGLGFLSHFMYQAAQDLISQADFIIPVPLHKKRLQFRRYNQSALLAWKLGKTGNISVLPMGLIRTKETVPLGHFNKQERQNLLQNAFAVRTKDRKKLQNKRVILVDDVMTTGSTLIECALTLQKAGVAHIDVVVTIKVA